MREKTCIRGWLETTWTFYIFLKYSFFALSCLSFFSVCYTKDKGIISVTISFLVRISGQIGHIIFELISIEVTVFNNMNCGWKLYAKISLR